MTHVQRVGGQESPAEVRLFEDLGPSGLLWLINRVVFHPRGMALALHREGDAVIGWSLLRGGDNEPMWFPVDDDIESFRRAQTTLNGDAP